MQTPHQALTREQETEMNNADFEKIFSTPEGKGLLQSAGLRIQGGFKSFAELGEMQGLPAWEMLLSFTDQVNELINGNEESFTSTGH
jgi:hypothetical protein